MKIKHRIAFVLALSLVGLCRGALEFSGYIQTGNEFKFTITDAANKASSGWIALGQSFKGHTLLAFDQKKEVLSVKDGESTIELPLKRARVSASQTDSSDTAAQLAAAKEELARLRVRYRDEHPTVRALLAKIAALEAQSAK